VSYLGEVVYMMLRPADFAGSWYPAKDEDCRKSIAVFEKDFKPCPSPQEKLSGGIVPHAGWMFSGSIACNVIQCLGNRQSWETCLIFGKHLRPSSRHYIIKDGSWETPFGPIAIDTEVAEALASEFSFTVETPERYEPDNTIELQLPFIKYYLPETRIVPMGVPPADLALEIGRRAAEICKEKGRSVCVLGSTDLTHYGYNYGFEPKGTGAQAVEWVKTVNDHRAIDLIIRMKANQVIKEAMNNANACCSGAVAAAIASSRELGALKGQIVKYGTSYDVHPDRSFVGYVGIVFTG
jgi:AmmeMemoRadiSam system protein B